MHSPAKPQFTFAECIGRSGPRLEAIYNDTSNLPFLDEFGNLLVTAGLPNIASACHNDSDAFSGAISVFYPLSGPAGLFQPDGNTPIRCQSVAPCRTTGSLYPFAGTRLYQPGRAAFSAAA